LGAGNAHSLTPRIGVQFDANARTRVKQPTRPVEMQQMFKASPALKITKSFLQAPQRSRSLSLVVAR